MKVSKFKTKKIKPKHQWGIGVLVESNGKEEKPGTPRLNSNMIIYMLSIFLFWRCLLKTFMMVPIQTFMGELYRGWNSIGIDRCQ